jgi:hypothetical protein
MAKQPNQYTKTNDSSAGVGSGNSRQSSFGESLENHDLSWLQDRASQLNIEGRSSMNKQELITAIQRQDTR